MRRKCVTKLGSREESGWTGFMWHIMISMIYMTVAYKILFSSDSAAVCLCKYNLWYSYNWQNLLTMHFPELLTNTWLYKLQGLLVAQIINMLRKIVCELPSYNNIIFLFTDPSWANLCLQKHVGSRIDSTFCFLQYGQVKLWKNLPTKNKSA